MRYRRVDGPTKEWELVTMQTGMRNKNGLTLNWLRLGVYIYARFIVHKKLPA
jgi:hypothetical protein